MAIGITDAGNQVQLSVINCDVLENINYQVRRVAIIIEEMVHFYWGITDELKIKYIVLYLINIGWPLIEIDDLFALDTIPKKSQIQALDLDRNAFNDKIKFKSN